jgi:hypothetical protein
MTAQRTRLRARALPRPTHEASLTMLTLSRPRFLSPSLGFSNPSVRRRPHLPLGRLAFPRLRSPSNPGALPCPARSRSSVLVAQKSTVQIWLYDNTSVRMEGVIVVRSDPFSRPLSLARPRAAPLA